MKTILIQYQHQGTDLPEELQNYLQTTKINRA